MERQKKQLLWGLEKDHVIEIGILLNFMIIWNIIKKEKVTANYFSANRILSYSCM